MAIRNLIFDYGGVITDLSLRASKDAFAALGLDVERLLGQFGHEGLFAAFEEGRIGEEEFYAALRAKSKLKIQNSEFKKAWCAMLLGVPERRLRMLEKLSREYNLALLSNTNAIHWQYSVEHFFTPLGFRPERVFRHLFLSYRMGLAKPCPEIFAEVLRKSGWRPEETLFIDDSEANCAAFARLGVHTLTPAEPDDWMPKAATIGFFDGVHRGHRCLIGQLRAEAERRGLASEVITFDRHPRLVLDDAYRPALLTTLDEKLRLLRETGVDLVRLLPFTRELAQRSAREFMREVLREQLNVRLLVMGYDHRFGHGGGTREEYAAWGREAGIEVLFADELGGEKTSSSVIRRRLGEGDVEGATRLLAHAFCLTGRVVRGRGVGHQIGFPTANLLPASDKLMPPRGVYAVSVTLTDGTLRAGMLNVGRRPTLHNGHDTTYEVHILDFEGDLYGQTLTVALRRRLRTEREFASIEELRAQLARDAQEARNALPA